MLSTAAKVIIGVVVTAFVLMAVGAQVAYSRVQKAKQRKAVIAAERRAVVNDTLAGGGGRDAFALRRRLRGTVGGGDIGGASGVPAGLPGSGPSPSSRLGMPSTDGAVSFGAAASASDIVSDTPVVHIRPDDPHTVFVSIVAVGVPPEAVAATVNDLYTQAAAPLRVFVGIQDFGHGAVTGVDTVQAALARTSGDRPFPLLDHMSVMTAAPSEFRGRFASRAHIEKLLYGGQAYLMTLEPLARVCKHWDTALQHQLATTEAEAVLARRTAQIKAASTPLVTGVAAAVPPPPPLPPRHPDDVPGVVLTTLPTIVPSMEALASDGAPRGTAAPGTFVTVTGVVPGTWWADGWASAGMRGGVGGAANNPALLSNFQSVFGTTLPGAGAAAGSLAWGPLPILKASPARAIVPCAALMWTASLTFCRAQRRALCSLPDDARDVDDDKERAWMTSALLRNGWTLMHPAGDLARVCMYSYTRAAPHAASGPVGANVHATLLMNYVPIGAHVGIGDGAGASPLTPVLPGSTPGVSTRASLGLTATAGEAEYAVKVGSREQYATLVSRLQLSQWQS